MYFFTYAYTFKLLEYSNTVAFQKANQQKIQRNKGFFGRFVCDIYKLFHWVYDISMLQ